jgi:hypothetical protein
MNSGNEDMFAQDSYQAYRWPMFVNQLSARFPDLHFLATSYPELNLDPVYKYSKLVSLIACMVAHTKLNFS